MHSQPQPDIQPFEDVDLYWFSNNGEEQKIDIDFIKKHASPTRFINGEVVESEIGDIEDVYVARVHIQWKYDDMLYGMDKDWWKDDVFKERVKDTDYSTYNKAVNTAKKWHSEGNEIEHILILYQVDGEWHILHGNRLSSLRAMTFDGKTVIYGQ